MVKTKDKVADAAGNVKPYVERALKDEELRDNLKNAFESARQVYSELVGGRGVASMASRVATDKEIQENLRSAVEELRRAADRLQGKGRHKGHTGTLLLAGIALGILFNPMTGPETRKWIKELIFGEGDTFGYEAGSGNSGSSSS